MKKFLILLSILFYGAAFAQTETLNWYMDGNIYTTTQCESGNDILLPTTPTKRGYTFKGWASYTPIEYLEGINNNQYIDTGIIPNANMSLYIKFSLITHNYANAMPLGVRNTSGGQDGITLFMDYSIGINTDWFNGTPDTRFRTGIIPKTYSVYEVSVSDYLMTIKENNTIIATHKFIPQVTTSRNLYINAINNAGETSRSFADVVRIYGFTIEGVIDLIPVLDPAGVPCMYDKVERKFYYNAGTGQFIAGPVVGE